MRLPLTLHLKPSRRLAAALVVAHAVAAAALAVTVIPAGVKAAGAFGLALSLAFALRRVLRPPFAALTLLADGRLDALRADGTATALTVGADTVVFPWLVVLFLRGDRRVALALSPDALAPGGHRELRLWLRWKSAPEVRAGLSRAGGAG